MNRVVSALTCEMRALSHEALAQLAARNLHALTVARDMLYGKGLEARALEVIEDCIGARDVEAERAAVEDEAFADMKRREGAWEDNGCRHDHGY